MACVRCLMIAFTVNVLRGCSGVKALTPSLNGCLPYVSENKTLACTCTADCQGTISAYWVNINPPNDQLLVQPVKREDDGKRFTCHLNCDGQTSAVNYTLRVAYGPTSDFMSVSGDLPFKTNGTQVLNLTCLATAVNPPPQYYWRGENFSACAIPSVHNICSFVPQREDDLKVTTCWARNSADNYLKSYKNFTIHLNYPPTESPHIEETGHVLKARDTLSCTVTGGKQPQDLSVHFFCENPHHPDKDDTVNSTSVTSYITVDTSNATDNNMTCHCSVRWAPEPSYYTTSVSACFQTEYPAKMIAFTMNELIGTLTVKGPTNVTLKCEAHGRPRPNITLHGPNQSDLTGNVTHSDDAHSRMEHTIVTENDTHMGNFTCISNNGVGKVAYTLIILNVDFPPRLTSSDGPGHSPDTAVNMSEQGISITLRAFPTPHIFRFTGYKARVGHAGNSSLDYMFNATTSERIPGSPEVTCHIRPEHTVQKGWLYAVNISNGFGSVPYYFSVNGAPPPPAVTTSPLPNGTPGVGDIVGGVVGGVVALVIIVVVVVVVWKRKYRRYEKPQPKRDQDSSPYTGLQVMQGTDQQQSDYFENSLQNTQRPSPSNYANMTVEPSSQPASPHYVNAQLKKASNSSSANDANTEPRPDLAQSSGDYVNLETRTNHYEQLQSSTVTEGNVYKTLDMAR